MLARVHCFRQSAEQLHISPTNAWETASCVFNNIAVRKAIRSHLRSQSHLVEWRSSPPHQSPRDHGGYQTNEGQK